MKNDSQLKLEFVGEMTTGICSPQKDAYIENQKAETATVLLQTKVLGFYELGRKKQHEFFNRYSNDVDKKELAKCHLSNFSLANMFFLKYLKAISDAMKSSNKDDFTQDELREMSNRVLTKSFFNLPQVYGKIISHRQKFFFKKFYSFFLKKSKKQKLS